jgi:TPR repeat protein/chromosome segregation ATPase
MRQSLNQRQYLLLASALLALGPVLPLVVAKQDIAAVRVLAESGDAEALNTLGNAYANGLEGMPKDEAKALGYYEQACARGYIPAHFNLGTLYELGHGTPKDPVKAFGHYLKAAERGFMPAQFNVGNMYAKGIGTKQDDFESVLWFRLAASQGMPEAQYNLALSYEAGRGVGKDESKARTLYKEAARQNHARACYNLALMLEDGRGGPKDEVGAAEFYLTAAKQNYGPAQNNYAVLLAEGRGGLQANLVRAAAWMLLAAENGAQPKGRDLLFQGLSADQKSRAEKEAGEIRAQLGGRPGQALAASAVSAPNTETPPNQIAALQANITALQSQMSKIEAQNKQLRDETVSLRASLAAAQKTPAVASGAAVNPGEAARLREELALARRMLKNAESDKVLLNDEVKRATVELGNLNRKIREFSTTTPASDDSGIKQKLSAAELELATLRREAVTAKMTLDTANEALATAKRLEEQKLEALRKSLVASGQAKIAELEANLKAAQSVASSAALDPLKSEVSRLQKELEASRSAAAAAQKTMADSESLGKQLETANLNLGRKNTELETKLEAAKQEAAAAVSRIAQGTATLAELTPLKSEVSRLQKELEAAKAAAAAKEKTLADAEVLGKQLETANLNLGKKNTELETKLETAKQEAAAAVSRIAQGTATLAELTPLKSEVSRLQKELEAAKATAAAKEKTLADAEAKTLQLETALESAKRAVAEAQDKTVQSSTAIAQLSPLKDEVTRLQKELDASKSAAVATQKTLADAETLGKQFEEANQSLARKLTTLEEEKSTLSARLTQAAAATTNSLAQVAAQASGLAELSALKKDLAAARESATTLSADLEAKTREIVELRKDLELSSQGTAAALAAQAAAVKALPNAQATLLEMQTLQGQVARLETQLEEERKRAAGEMAALATQLQRARETNQALSDTNRTLTQTFASGEAALRTQVESLQSKLLDAGAQAEKLKGDYDQLRAKHAESELALEKQGGSVAELTALNEKLATDKAALESQLAKARQEAEVVKADAVALRGKLEESDKALGTQGGSVAQLTALNEKLGTDKAALEAQFAKARQEAEAVKADALALRGKLEESDKALGKQGGSVAELTALNVKLGTDKAALETQLAKARQEAEAVKADALALRGKLEASEKTLGAQGGSVAQLTEQNRTLGAEKVALDIQLAKARQELEAFQNDSASLRAKLDEAEKTLGKQNGSVTELAALGERTKAEKEALQQHLEKLTAQHEAAKTELAALPAQIEKIQQALAEEKNNASALRTELAKTKEQAQAQDRDRASRLAQLQQENTSLVARLRQAQSTLESIAAATRMLNQASASVLGSVPAPTASRSASQSPISAAPLAAEAPRTHVVTEGDSLSRISLRYYGTSARWQEVYEANKETLKGENSLRAGQKLVIP